MNSPVDRLAAALANRYRILRELGQGGMATVYLAADLKHDRQVAIKVLKPELAAVLGAERFVVEIKTTAQLQHPHILPLHDSGEAGGFLYYVMPYIQGETLRTRLDREKQLGIDEAVKITTEVADALDYAHRHGVIHRDIKPENILLHDGRPMVADFGIALAVSAAAGGRMTETGLSLGTPHYMSPEQALGEREITARSDVYALGCVLYEMLTGEPPFTGPTAQAIIAKVVTDDPRPPSELRKTVPPQVEAATLTALAKLPADRFASAAAFAAALANPAYRVGGIRAGVSAAAGRSERARAVITLVVGVAVGAIGMWLALRARGKTAVRVQPPLQITFSGRAGTPAISPDGRFVAFLEQRCPEPPTSGGCASLEVLEIGSTNPVEVISGADRLGPPRWTHDGLSLVVAGKLSDNRTGLYAVPRLGGTPRRIGDEPSAYDTHPKADSVLAAFDVADSTELRTTSLADAQIPTLGRRVPAKFRAVAWSPDARLIAGMSYGGEVYVMPRDGSTLSSSPLVYGRDQLRWSTDGRHLLMFRGGIGQEDYLSDFPVGTNGALGTMQSLPLQLPTLYAGRFDVARSTGRLVVGTGMETTDVWSFDLGRAVAGERRLTQGTNWYGPPVPASDGHTVYYLRADALGDNLYALADGRERPLTGEHMLVDNAVRVSLDGRQLSFEARIGGQSVLVLYDVVAGTARRIGRPYRATGWQIRSGGNIAWLDISTHTAWTTDSAGNNPHPLSLPPIGVLDKNGGGWALAPDGASLAVLGSTPEGYTVVRVPLDGGRATPLRDIPATAIEQAAGQAFISGQYYPVGVGLAGWSREGIYLSRAAADGRETELLVVDPRTRAMRRLTTLPEHCAARTTSVATDGGKVVCIVTDSRTDLSVIDGVRP